MLKSKPSRCRVLQLSIRIGIAFSLVAGCIALSGCERASQVSVAESTDGVISADLKIDFGDGTNKEFSVTTSSPATVLSLLEAAAAQGAIELEFIGSGERAFVESLDKITNEGPGGKNWNYRVNGKLGLRSSGVADLKDKDVVEWTRGIVYKPEEETE